MKVFLSIIHVVVAIALMAVILLQQRKTGGFAGIFGGGTQADGGGSWQRFTALTKITVVLSTLFMVSSLVLVVL